MNLLCWVYLLKLVICVKITYGILTLDNRYVYRSAMSKVVKCENVHTCHKMWKHVVFSFACPLVCLSVCPSVRPFVFTFQGLELRGTLL